MTDEHRIIWLFTGLDGCPQRATMCESCPGQYSTLGRGSIDRAVEDAIDRNQTRHRCHSAPGSICAAHSGNPAYNKETLMLHAERASLKPRRGR